MAILETKSGERYKVNEKVEIKGGEPFIDGMHFSQLETVKKKCKCISSCKKS